MPVSDGRSMVGLAAETKFWNAIPSSFSISTSTLSTKGGSLNLMNLLLYSHSMK